MFEISLFLKLKNIVTSLIAGLNYLSQMKIRFDKYILVSLLLYCVIICSCSKQYQNALFKSDLPINVDTIKTVHVINDKGAPNEKYRIKANDALSIRNIQDDNFLSTSSVTKAATSNIFRVEDDGTVILPVINAVSVVGLTRKEASDKIQTLYKKNLLKDPLIELTVLNLKVTLFGEFGSQGNFLLEKENTSLVDILGMAGGITPKANPKTLKIIRGDRSNPEIIYVNLRNIKSLASPKLILQNNDILYIEPLPIYNTSERLQSITIVIQPLLLIVSTALLLLNFTK